MSQIKRQTKIPGNVHEYKEPKFVLVSSQGVASTKSDDEDTPKGDCVSLGPRQDTKVNALTKISSFADLGCAFKGMMINTFGKKTYRARLSGTQSVVAYSSSSSATLKASWDPSGLSSFTDFALLFSQYRVKEVLMRVWFPGESSVAGTGTSIFLVGADPGMLIATPTSVNVSDLQKSESWNCIITSKKTACFTAVASEVPLILDKSGFLDVTSSWSGQTCVYAAADASSSLTSFNYQLIFEVEFRNRF
jgi:hypothetical protein